MYEHRFDPPSPLTKERIEQPLSFEGWNLLPLLEERGGERSEKVSRVGKES
jgi:hypothetical protein